MPLTLVLPERYPWVILAAQSSFWLLGYQVNNVASKRKKAGVKYPYLYAEKADAEKSKEAMIFNCAQRAHQNTLESIPVVLLSTLFAGLYYPTAAAAGCGAWVLGRILYTIGYSTGDPSKRNAYGGWLSSIAMLGLGVLGTWTSVKMVRDVL